jgi:hypothetical protein
MIDVEKNIAERKICGIEYNIFLASSHEKSLERNECKIKKNLSLDTQKVCVWWKSVLCATCRETINKRFWEEIMTHFPLKSYGLHRKQKKSGGDTDTQTAK